MNTNVISQTLKNIASDSDISQMIPRAFVPLEVVAASTAVATEIARIAGKDEPDRHDFLEAVPKYLGSLPKNVEMALEVIKMDAAAVLGIPQLATDYSKLSEAQRRRDEAQAEVDAAELLQGKRLGRIHRLESDLSDAVQQLESWNIDFDSEVAQNEATIVENYGKHSVSGCFDRIAAMEVLRRLAPGAIAGIKGRIKEIEGELVTLRAATVPEVKLTRGKQTLPV